MGWFWADAQPSPGRVPPRPSPRSDTIPARSYPGNHALQDYEMLLQLEQQAKKRLILARQEQDRMERAALSAPTTTDLSSGACPYIPPSSATKPDPSNNTTFSKLNPLNFMPATISQERATTQTTTLPTVRETSTIPKGTGTGNWEYPSPQQMYNAMLRKGYTDTPEDAVESMVAVHNFLNEGAWREIVEWERRFSGGLRRGWRECSRGEDGTPGTSSPTHSPTSLNGTSTADNAPETFEPRLTRFMGRPNDLTPKAKMIQVLAWMFPAQFTSEPPFDRHDWFVLRRSSKDKQREVRYVIDYYSGPPEPTGEPVFYLDVRPAIDGPTAAVERMMRWGGDVWWRASGGVVREMEAERQQQQARR